MRYLTIIYFIVSFNVSAQIEIKGQIQNTDNKPIEFVNTGIVGRNIGTISDEKGSFLLKLSDKNTGDTLTFSRVGFEDKQVPIKDIITQHLTVFKLKEKVNQLPEIVVSARTLRIKRIGTKSVNPMLWGNVESKDKSDIVEFGKLISVERVSDVQELSVFLKGVNIDTATFRINFYGVKNDLPDGRLSEQNIVARRAITHGWLNLDLKPYKLLFDQDFFVTIEFLPEKTDKKYSFAYGGQLTGSYVSRTASLGEWNKTKGVSISMYVTVLQ
jgi:hypothetical protein